jgi:hypothetical protein
MNNQRPAQSEDNIVYQAYQLDYSLEAAADSGEPPAQRFILRDASGKSPQRTFDSLDQVMDFVLDTLLKT